MAIKSKALVGFPGMKDDELMVAANTIVAAMTDNSNFPEPSPDLDVISNLRDDYSDKLAASRKRGAPEDFALKDESKDELAERLQQLGHYVNSVARGRLSIVLSSGFPTNSPDAPPQAPTPVENVRVSDGRQSGQVKLDFAKQKNVRVYEYQYRMADLPNEPWSERYTTTSSRGNIIAPLDPARYYEVHVRAINTHGIGDWSQIVRILAR